ncbi:Zinc-type alcohol dehydrogenase-like protein [Cercospora beticola]|uniref:Zinc-type alcohol dehydrogenase-like protein n=1 Tax=Cercospora beticola TaxID=122368 RepID=A0A2G5HJ52_CERBT|nr:Zinc-type alcohol dehydrogenase-like protein [Cercospora beticola]PIA92568.1 Zinc-type alcohol dehydrogenase-like protein [Cercospora beticola]WPB01395.1 hypothetical protein RHO25_006021 [Cercospora beticola]CAK1363825.1 unnamed protein product [Cercospora beticola]
MTSGKPAGEAKEERVSQWILPSTSRSIRSLGLDRDATLGSLGENEVRVKLYAAGLNYRDLMIAKGLAPGPIRAPHVVPGSDGAGIVEAVGSNVKDFQPGDKVLTHLTPLFDPSDESSMPDMKAISSGLGHTLDGTLRSRGNFPASGLFKMPANLSFLEASTLTCSGLTAYNALFGLKGREIKQGDWVMIQGTGGVSIAALQFAVAVGANVVATTSNAEKGRLLKELGAREVVNYRESREWGGVVKSFTPGGRGFDVVVDVGGDSTLEQSLEAVRTDGVVALTGLLGGAAEPVKMLAALMAVCTVRGVLLGSKKQMRELVRFVEEKNLKPVLDFRTWDLDEVKRAYDWLENQKHFSKVVIHIE